MDTEDILVELLRRLQADPALRVDLTDLITKAQANTDDKRPLEDNS